MSSVPFKPPEPGQALRRGMISGLVGLVVIILVSVAVGRSQIEPGTIEALWARASLPPLLASWAAMSIAFLFLGMRWAALFPPPHKPPGTGLAAILCAGLLLNSALPGPVGEFGAAWFAHKRYRVPLGMSLAAGMGARIIGMLMAAGAAFICWWLTDFPIPEGYASAIQATGVFIGLLALGLGTVVLWPQMLERISLATFGRLELRAAQLIHNTVVEVSNALTLLRKGNGIAIIRCIAWSGIAHAFVLGGIAIAAWAVGASPSIPGLLFTYATTTAAVVVMFALPGSQVGWDAIFLALLTATAGLTLPDALAVAILVRVQQLSIMVAGAIALNWLLRSTPSTNADASITP